MGKAKTSIYTDAETLALWDALAKERGINRSAFLALLMRDEATRRNVTVEAKAKPKPKPKRTRTTK